MSRAKVVTPEQIAREIAARILERLIVAHGCVSMTFPHGPPEFMEWVEDEWKSRSPEIAYAMKRIALELTR